MPLNLGTGRFVRPWFICFQCSFFRGNLPQPLFKDQRGEPHNLVAALACCFLMLFVRNGLKRIKPPKAWRRTPSLILKRVGVGCRNLALFWGFWFPSFWLTIPLIALLQGSYFFADTTSSFLCSPKKRSKRKETLILRPFGRINFWKTLPVGLRTRGEAAQTINPEAQENFSKN